MFTCDLLLLCYQVKYYGKAEEKRKIYENEYQKFLARHPELKDRKT